MMENRLHPMMFATIVLVWAGAPGVAMAYIDPGNGAYMVQVIFALIGAGLFYLRHPIRTLQAMGRWVSNRISGVRKHDPENDAVESRLEEPGSR